MERLRWALKRNADRRPHWPTLMRPVWKGRIMTRARPVIALCGAFLLFWGGDARAHGAGAPRGANAQVTADAIEITLNVDMGGQAKVVRVDRGALVHLSVFGAGAHELHLHGYDISIDAQDGEPAMFVFRALLTGRFAIVAHGVEDLLGRDEKPVVYVEVREP
jgi:hypothetical protein